MPRRKRLVRYRENHAVETAFSDFDLNSRDEWEAVIKAAGGLKIHVKRTRLRLRRIRGGVTLRAAATILGSGKAHLVFRESSCSPR
jgi:hypothetical protein